MLPNLLGGLALACLATSTIASPIKARNRNCFVKSSGGDDAQAILSAFKKCNNGGTVVLDADYTIGSPLELTFLEHVDICLSGTITFTDDIPYWTDHAFQYAFQNSSSFWKIGGKDVNFFGGGIGLIDGNGQVWWEAMASNSSLQRPITMVIEGLEGGTFSGISMLNPPNWFNFVANATDLIVSNFNLTYFSTNSSTKVSNTDGWDTYRSSYVTIQDSTIHNTDDCVAFKPNSTNIVVQGLHCNGSHGISVGSLGQYVEEYDIVEDVYVYNNSMSNASDGARIKVWPGIQSGTSPLLNGGGGSGYVKNVTYDTYANSNNDYIIELNQCYEQSNQTLCELYPSKMVISDIHFQNFWGTSSKKYDPIVGSLVCSGDQQCFDIYGQNVTITDPSGKTPEWKCDGFNSSGLIGFNCVA